MPFRGRREGMMSNLMRVMVGYDGSRYADAAIDDLRRAGLPSNGNALVASIVDSSKMPVLTDVELGQMGKFFSPRLLAETVEHTQKEKARLLNEEEILGCEGARRVVQILPGWSVISRSTIGDPAEELIRTAEEWKANLIVVGSHGWGRIGRFFLGSVSAKIAEKATNSVRVWRGDSGNSEAPTNKVILGATNLKDAETIFRAIGARSWSEDTEFHLVAVDDGVSRGRISAVYPYGTAIFEQAAENLLDKGFRVSVDLRGGDPRAIFLEEAENRKADSIFVLSGKTNEESGLNETAASLVTDAPCTVEIVRSSFAP